MSTFGARLRAATSQHGPLCAGLDPHASLLEQWGLGDDLDGLRRFTDTVVEAFAGQVAVVKPQSAFYERFGAAGVLVLEDAIRNLRAAGTLVLLDVKRGDIGSTAQAYADAYLRTDAPMAVDAITASPYLGFGSVLPMIETARANDAGVFVLALTSNPEGRQVQHARTDSGSTVAGEMLASLAALNQGAEPLGSFGAVVGATIQPTDEDLRINGPLLAPGIGAQGGTLESVRQVFGDAVGNVLPASSREILSAGPGVAAVRAAAHAAAESFAALQA
ncbi:MAG: orotidine-5'-phosphate decarboxylase [Nocardioidaceae bacterium]|nr:MAG: orotidine-5'-phosphate decarboxylase [Nocardioidaceae bacterium]